MRSDQGPLARGFLVLVDRRLLPLPPRNAVLYPLGGGGVLRFGDDRRGLDQKCSDRLLFRPMASPRLTDSQFRLVTTAAASIPPEKRAIFCARVVSTLALRGRWGDADVEQAVARALRGLVQELA